MERMKTKFNGEIRFYTSKKGNSYIVKEDPTDPEYEYHGKITICEYCGNETFYKYPFGKVPQSDPEFPHNPKVILNRNILAGEHELLPHPFPCAHLKKKEAGSTSTNPGSPGTPTAPPDMTTPPTSTITDAVHNKAVKVYNEIVVAWNYIKKAIEMLEYDFNIGK